VSLFNQHKWKLKFNTAETFIIKTYLIRVTSKRTSKFNANHDST
jgi:hypothetical protein